MFAMNHARDRPSGVTVLVILHIIIGIIAAFTGLLLIVAYAHPSSLGGFSSFAVSIVGVAVGYGYLVVGVAVLWFVFSVFSFILVYALWTGQGWSWMTSLVLAWNGLIIGGLGLLLGVLANALALAVYALILIYLFLPSVRMFFGRVQNYLAPPPAYVIPTAGQTNWIPPQYQYVRGKQPYQNYHQTRRAQAAFDPTERACPMCRAVAPYGAVFCNVCGTRLA